MEQHNLSVLDISPQELEFETTGFGYNTVYKWVNATSNVLAPTRCRCWCWGDSQVLKVLRNVFHSIWAPETWPSYSLCFPCFFSFPYFILFCIQNPYILQSYEKVGVLFTSSTSYFLWQSIFFIFITKKEITSSRHWSKHSSIGFAIASAYCFFFFCHTFSVVVPVETVPCSVSEFMTVQQVAHVVNLEAEQWEVDFCICLTVCLHAHLLTSDPPSPLPRQCSCLGLLLAYRKSGSRKNGAYSACRHSNIFASVSHR